jgi:hyaluronan synthase
VPATYNKLCRMLIRWDRSYIREEINFLSRVIWTRPSKHFWPAFFDRVVTNAYIPIYYLSLPLMILYVEKTIYIPLYFALYIGWISIFYLLYYLRQQRSGSMLYAILYPYYAACALFWIFPYSMFTAKNGSWVTR